MMELKTTDKMQKTILIGLFLFFSCKSDYITQENTIAELKKDIIYLSEDKLEGRETGTEGEKKALEYLNKRFTELGLKTKVSQFNFNKNVEIIFSSNIKNIFPTKYSSNGKIDSIDIINVGFGIEDKQSGYNDYNSLDVENKAVLINTSSPDGIHPHSKYLNYHDLKNRAEYAKNKGAAAVIYYTTDKNAETPSRKFKSIKNTGIPVLFLNDTEDSVEKYKLTLELYIKSNKAIGHNLIAEIDNHQENTIIIGAHYDHIGWGDEGSLYVGDKQIHNGADDNASGTAALLQLARFYKQSNFNNYNYRFIAFSGEEKGLLGSNAYANNSLIEPDKVNYMINMDMIGRLDKEGNLQISGTGSSPRWASLIEEVKTKDIIIKSSESGVGPSDHTSFYLKDIPVLHFFTGAHSDYHKPTDDHEKINFQGLYQVLSLIQSIINNLDDEEKVVFSTTKNTTTTTAPKFSVTLGVIPDYLYSEQGMRIDAIIDGRTADMSGMQDKDIVIKLGHIKITDMNAYMKALSYFNKGDRIKAHVLRNGNTIELDVTF